MNKYARNTNSDRDKLEKLRAQYAEISALAGALAHEIKNPLSVIGMNMELLAEDFEDANTPQERRALAKVEIVQAQCKRLQNLLDDFLRFARVRHIDMSPGSLNEQMERVLNLFEPQARKQGVEIVRYLDPETPSILLDEQTLQAAYPSVNRIPSAARRSMCGVR